MSLVDELIAVLKCPGCSSQDWDLRADGTDDLPKLEGTLCCRNCGQAFAARGGVLDMVPSIVESKAVAFRRRMISPPVAKAYEERIRHFFTPLASPLDDEERKQWLKNHAPPTPSEGIIVDYGCGRGSDLSVMREAAEPKIALGIDVSQVLLAEAARDARIAGHKNVVFLRSNLEDLPLSGEIFKWASCYGVLHRLKKPSQSLEKLADLLIPEGIFTCLTTYQLDIGGMAFGQAALKALGRIHLFDRDDLEEMFKSSSLGLLDLKAYGPIALLAASKRSS